MQTECLLSQLRARCCILIHVCAHACPRSRRASCLGRSPAGAGVVGDTVVGDGVAAAVGDGVAGAGVISIFFHWPVEVSCLHMPYYVAGVIEVGVIKCMKGSVIKGGVIKVYERRCYKRRCYKSVKGSVKKKAGL